MTPFEDIGFCLSGQTMEEWGRSFRRQHLQLGGRCALLKIIKILKPNYVIIVVSKVCLDLLVIKHNCTEVRHILREDSVASRVVAVFVTGESLRKSSDILDTCGNNH